MSGRAIYLDGRYLAKNPAWHAEEAPWKARQVLRMLSKHQIVPRTICDVGCGTGEVLRQLQENLNHDCIFLGYDVSPQAFELAKGRANEKLLFRLADPLKEKGNFDLILVLDVIEHLEDYFTFLQGLRARGYYKIFHIPLDLSVQTVFRKKALLKRRDLYAHVHYFTKETALRTLVDTGYEVQDYFYTPRSIDFGSEPGEKLLKLPRKVCFTIHKDLAARLLGGFSLLVLAR